MGWFSSLLEPSSQTLVKRVNAQETRVSNLSDTELGAETARLKARLAQGATPLDILPEAFAACREAARRTLGMRHFDVQVLGGIELARGHIVEMKTGEGKTLVATLPAYLHALQGQGVHVITVNDYLARRDAEWMGPAYRALGLSVGIIQEDMSDDFREDIRLRREAYACDITYVTNSEVVFDFLRDNLAPDLSEITQRGFHFAIVDEMDLLLIDEAQTPLIISGRGKDDTGIFLETMRIIRRLRPGEHFKAERRTRTAGLTEAGLSLVEQSLGRGSLAAPQNQPYFHAVHQCMQAHAVYDRDVDYIVEEGNIYLVDEHTGRVSPDKRFSNGLHQALEAKEGVHIKSEDTTLAKTSYQQFFVGYPHLAGMTGTAYTERDEFQRVYHLKVKRLPTHRPMVRKDYNSTIYKSLAAKHQAVMAEIQALHGAGRPVLVGTVSVRESEDLSALLSRAGLVHRVLNAKQHAQEAEIVAQAGRLGAITISTNMAGRGTDILLGGNAAKLAAQDAEPGTPEYEAALARYTEQCAREREQVVAAGGLAVIGTGEHDSERIDDQLRGRAGRQGDPGSSEFFLSLDDPVYRKFGEQKTIEELRELVKDHPEEEPLRELRVRMGLGSLRKKVEIENQAIRMDVVKYDLVVHGRREAIWGWRRRLLHAAEASSWREQVSELIDDLVGRTAEATPLAPPAPPPTEDGEEARETPPPLSPAQHAQAVLARIIGRAVDPQAEETPQALDAVADYLEARYQARLGTDHDAELVTWERRTLLGIIDQLWPQFLTDLERTEEGIGLRGYGNLDPVVEFRREAAILFNDFMRDVQTNALRLWLAIDPHAAIAAAEAREAPGTTRVLPPRQRRAPRGGEEPARPRAIDKLPAIGRSRKRKRPSKGIDER